MDSLDDLFNFTRFLKMHSAHSNDGVFVLLALLQPEKAPRDEDLSTKTRMFYGACLCLGAIIEHQPSLQGQKLQHFRDQWSKNVWTWLDSMIQHLISADLPYNEISQMLTTFCRAHKTWETVDTESSTPLPSILRLWTAVATTPMIRATVMSQPDTWDFIKRSLIQNLYNVTLEWEDEPSQHALSLLERDKHELGNDCVQHLLMDAESEANWRSDAVICYNNPIVMTFRAIAIMDNRQPFGSLFSYDATVRVAIRMLKTIGKQAVDPAHSYVVLDHIASCFKHLKEAIGTVSNRAWLLDALRSDLLDSICSLGPWIILASQRDDGITGDLDPAVDCMVTLISLIEDQLVPFLCYADVLWLMSRLLQRIHWKTPDLDLGKATFAFNKMLSHIQLHLSYLPEPRCNNVQVGWLRCSLSGLL